MTVKELKDMLEELDENKQIKVACMDNFRNVVSLDVWFVPENVWTASGDSLQSVYTMRGVMA